MALPLTDRLALERNRLANERTLLAYIRTFLSFVVAGVSLIQFFEVRVFIVLGFILIPSGFLILLSGVYRYIRVRKRLNASATS
jgi:putative membrane protein